MGKNLNQVFRGNFDHLLDEKGRVSLPVNFRDVVASRNVSSVVLTNFICDGARCLEGFPEDQWRAFEARLAQRSRFEPKLRTLENYYLARAADCGIDSCGRILIPQHLRTYAGLEKEVVFTSTVHGFRIWDARVWGLVFREAEQALLENPSLFSDVDIS